MNQNKLFSYIATALASILMLTALVYYNFLDKPTVSGVEVGNKCPDFTVNTYKIEDGLFKTGGEPFTLSEQRGKIVIINFWATYCAPCKAEIPEFNQIQEAYKEDVVVITLDGEISFPEERLAGWLNINPEPVNAKWNTFSIKFGTYNANVDDLYAKLGFSGALPSTLIVNREGEIVFKAPGLSMHYEDLERELTPLLKY